METYKYKVILHVEVEAFDETDAWDALQDAFGVGDNFGVSVVQCEYEEAKKPRKKK